MDPSSPYFPSLVHLASGRGLKWGKLRDAEMEWDNELNIVIPVILDRVAVFEEFFRILGLILW